MYLVLEPVDTETTEKRICHLGANKTNLSSR